MFNPKPTLKTINKPRVYSEMIMPRFYTEWSTLTLLKKRGFVLREKSKSKRLDLRRRKPRKQKKNKNAKNFAQENNQ